jgi:signal transduction histidine kinase
MILDVIVLTLLIVSTEGRTPLLTLYILYVLAIGLFFGFRFSLPPAISGIFFFILCSVWLTPSSPWTYTNLINLIKDTGWLVILLGTVSIIALNHARSVWQKERTLTYRERELAAMQNISSATRKMLPLEGLVHLVLTELIYGLRFDFGFLLLLDPDNGFLRIYHARTGKYDEMIEKIFGFPLSSVYLSNLAVSNSFFRAIKRKRTILHYRLSELVVGLEPKISAERARKFQDLSGLKIFIGVPMIADRQVIGGLVAATKNEDIPKEQIVSLQKFANQVGLAIESAQRFEEIERKNVALEKANRAKSDFLATMSHELRTPLTAIIGFSELMLQDFMGAISGEQKDAVQEILNNAENLLVLINRILEFEKIEAGKSSLELENFSLDQTILSVENSTKSLIAQKSLHMEMQLDRDIPPMLADEKKVRQILLNLISNAIKFTPKNGKITLKTAHQNGKDGLFDHPGVIVSVTDTGIGIEGKNFEKIFNAFEQVDGTTTREYEGTGLGLALTKRFVEVQGGKIWVESEFGKGSCFSFFIPLRVQDRPH